MSHLPEYYAHLIIDRGLTQNQAVEQLVLVQTAMTQNAFSSGASRRWFFANLGKNGGPAKSKGGGSKSGAAGASDGNNEPKSKGAIPKAVYRKLVKAMDAYLRWVMLEDEIPNYHHVSVTDRSYAKAFAHAAEALKNS